MTGAATRTLPAYAVAWRIVVSLTVAVVVALGTFIGDDGWWPFAPMSQYAFSVRNDGVINSLTMAATTVDGEEVRVPLSKEMIGIERSEIEGQAPRIINNPGLLQDVAVLHRRRLAHEPAYRTIWLQNTQRDIRTGETTVKKLVSWDVVDPENPQPSGISRDAR